MPDEGMEVRVWIPATDDEDAFDSIDHIEEGVWHHHYGAYEHYQAVGGANAGGGDCYCTGPSEEAPYTHWMPLPQPPSKGGVMSSDDCDTCADHAYRCDVAEQSVREIKAAAQALLDIFKPYETSNAYPEWKALEDAVRGSDVCPL